MGTHSYFAGVRSSLLAMPAPKDLCPVYVVIAPKIAIIVLWHVLAIVILFPARIASRKDSCLLD